MLCVHAKSLHSLKSLHYHLSPHTFFSFPPPLFPLGNHHTVVCVYDFVCLLNSFTFFTQTPTPSPLRTVSLFSYLWVCLYFVCQFILFIRFHVWVKSYGTCLMDLESVVLSEISQSEKHKSGGCSEPNTVGTCDGCGLHSLSPRPGDTGTVTW